MLRLKLKDCIGILSLLCDRTAANDIRVKGWPANIASATPDPDVRPTGGHLPENAMIMRAVLAALAFAFTSPLQAETVAEFYKGKQLRLIVGTQAGDGYDLWSRFVARHITRHVPGSPSIIVQNMPGAGTLTATNHLFNVAPKDGTTFGSFSRNLPPQAVLGRPNYRFDPREFEWIGSPETVNRVCVVGEKSSVKAIDDVFAREVIMGGMGSGMVPTVVPTILNQLVGTRFRVVEGYAGTHAIFLAIDRGEVDGLCMASSTLLGPSRHLIDSGKLRVLFSMEAKPMTDLPNVPTMFSRLKTDEQRQTVSFLNAALDYGRPFAAPPGVPADRVAALRTAFAAMVKDPEFLTEAKKLGYVITYTSGEELKELTETLYRTPREVMERAAALLPKG
jgi:tripartite-type tricarboxylate transporter receptor subunit TctC